MLRHSWMLVGLLAMLAMPATAQETITWKFNSVIPEASIGGKWQSYWANEVERHSGGRLKVDIFFGGELGYKGPEVLEVSRDGLADVNGFADTIIGGSIPEATVVGLGFLMPEATQGEIVREEVNRLIGEKMLKNWNTVLAGYWPGIGQTIITKKPILSVADLEEMKVRTSTGDQAKIVNLLGGFPQTLLFGEIYTSMQLGVVDGFITGARNVIDVKFYEVADYVALPAVNSVWNGVMVNKDAFDALPPDLQQVVLDAGETTSLKALRDVAVDQLQLANDLRKVGVEVTQLPAEELDQLRVKMVPIWEEWSASATPEGQELLRTIRAKLYPE